jgi:hypothetical protein
VEVGTSKYLPGTYFDAYALSGAHVLYYIGNMRVSFNREMDCWRGLLLGLQYLNYCFMGFRGKRYLGLLRYLIYASTIILHDHAAFSMTKSIRIPNRDRSFY